MTYGCNAICVYCIQNVCTFDALLTSHQLGWSIVPLQILMALILMEAAATLCHLEFVQYLTEQSLHIQRSIWMSSATPAFAPHPVGINLESEQENPSSSRPKTSNPDSSETCPTPHSDPPVMPSKPPVMPTKPEATPSKTPGATPMKSEATPSKTLDAYLRPSAMPRKCTLMPQKAVPGGSSDSAKDILDHVTAKYRSGMSPQYSNVLMLLISGKSSQVTAPMHTDPNARAGGNYAYVKGVTVILTIRRQNLLTRRQNVILVADHRPLMTGPMAPRRSLPRNPPRKCLNPRRPSFQTLIAVNPRTCVGNSALNPQRKRLKSANAGVLINGHLIC